ncbi:MOSC domain-containing protein [Chromobacterium sp. ATCC 53434]|uniref:MOSC domain-containing protein n=1 Tax=Chromobacterium sp. (strain ATCC 53434 / SC 14030) TaxID=2059672 RepID=UPI000C77AAFE|nr:MOSC domain-containing protein [Chromobacterium sp. ATCC 53434]AUH52677.1 MOSC domain-containing protein [Chromobacterium sp. ATCC 53434]
MQLTAMFVHPLKSTRGIAFDRAYAGPLGLLHDREWLLATPDGNQITARSHPQLLRVAVELLPGGLLLRYPGKPSICALATAFQRPHPAQVWKDSFEAWHGDERLDAWFADIVGCDCRLLWLGARSNRAFKHGADGMSFADGYPFLLVNQASLDDLNRQLEQPVALRNFRPNLVVSGDYPWMEDEWKAIRIGDIEFEVMKPCTRCVLTTVDPELGEKRADGEPLRTLVRTRRLDEGVCFGVNLRARNAGMLTLGAPLEIVEERYSF